MFRTIATKAVKLCSRAPSGACLTHTRCIHNVKLAELHKILHPTTETPLQLHGIKLHPEAHNQVTLNPDNLTIDQKAHVNSQPKMAVTESIWPEVGPLFEEVSSVLIQDGGRVLVRGRGERGEC